MITKRSRASSHCRHRPTTRATKNVATHCTICDTLSPMPLWILSSPLKREVSKFNQHQMQMLYEHTKVSISESSIVTPKRCANCVLIMSKLTHNGASTRAEQRHELNVSVCSTLRVCWTPLHWSSLQTSQCSAWEQSDSTRDGSYESVSPLPSGKTMHGSRRRGTIRQQCPWTHTLEGWSLIWSLHYLNTLLGLIWTETSWMCSLGEYS